MNTELEKEVSQEKTKELQRKEDIDALRLEYTDPKIFIPDRQKLGEYNDLRNITEKLTPDQKKRKEELSQELGMLYGLENGIWAANLARERYYGTLAQMRSTIVKDFNCKNSLELMLADRIVAHYWRAMRDDTVINMLTEEKDGGYTFNQQKINIIKELHRGVELADRHLNMDIILLKELKQPQLNIKVNTENAFIAQNQQFNVDKKINEA